MNRWKIADDVEELKLFGGSLCLDFANTVEWRHADGRHDHLGSYSDLVGWGAHAGATDRDTAAGLRREADGSPAEAKDVLGSAVALREAIYRTFHAVARDKSPDPDDLRVLGEAYARAVARYRIVATDDGGFGLAWRDTDALESPLWPVARSAVELLTGADPGRVKACPADDGCGWLFYDDSKNNRRRWCSMQGCGSRAKMRRMYARRRGGRERSDA